MRPYFNIQQTSLSVPFKVGHVPIVREDVNGYETDTMIYNIQNQHRYLHHNTAN
jgi:hypothetical protein